MAKEGVMSEDDNTPEEEYVVTETPPEPEPEQPAEEAVGEQVEAAEDEDEDDGDARLEASDDDEDDEPKAGRKPLTPEEKRAQRQNRKFRRRAAIEHKERELAFLRAENEEFKRRLQSVEQQTAKFNLSAVDQKLSEAQNEAQMAERIMAKAIELGNGEDAARALAIRDEARERIRSLQENKRQAEAPPEPVKRGPDPRVAAYAKEWISENSWYDPAGRDEDSAIVKVIDQRLAQEGYNPASEDYWIELNNRVAKRLPHKFQDEPMQESKPKAKRGGPPMATKREYAAPSSRKEVYISPERKQALIDAGVWDNPEERKRYIKRYAEYDRNSSSR